MRVLFENTHTTEFNARLHKSFSRDWKQPINIFLPPFQIQPYKCRNSEFHTHTQLDAGLKLRLEGSFKSLDASLKGLNTILEHLYPDLRWVDAKLLDPKPGCNLVGLVLKAWMQKSWSHFSVTQNSARSCGRRFRIEVVNANIMEKDYFYDCLERTEALTEELKSLIASLEDVTSVRVDQVESTVEKYLRQCYVFDKDGRISRSKGALKLRFPKADGFEWISPLGSASKNTLDLDAANNVIVLDFFTHCCINCIHSIEELRNVCKMVRSKYASSELNSELCGFRLVSIHSPKFATEKKVASIASSVERMHLEHAEVINDSQNKIWNQMGIFCWPTVLILGPNPDAQNPGPNILFAFVGEGKEQLIKLLCLCVIRFASRFLNQAAVQSFIQEKETNLSEVDAPARGVKKASPSFLHFPGKVSCYGQQILVSDSGNNRLVFGSMTGKLVDIIGGNEGGYLDGSYDQARFYNPQGTAFTEPGIVFVADTGNHCIRQISIETKIVSTLVKPKQTIGEGGVLMSPWDLCIYNQKVLLIAAAGNHQILGYFFEDYELFGKKFSKGTLQVIAGSGKEENRNNAYPLKASFAQPSGLSCARHHDLCAEIYIADSESSSIRCITLEGKVQAVVGGSKDPQDLFAYGDVDGTAVDVKLQHPIGIAVGNAGAFIADTYNHKIKKVVLGTKECATIIGTGEPGNKLGDEIVLSTAFSKTVQLNEPAGLALDDTERFLFIADTNNHDIKVADFLTHTISSFALGNLTGSAVPHNDRRDETFTLQMPTTPSVHSLTLSVQLHNLPSNFDGGAWEVVSDAYGKNGRRTGVIAANTPTQPLEFKVTKMPYVPWLREMVVSVTVLFCGDDACRRKLIKLCVEIEQSETVMESAQEEPVLTIAFKPDATKYFQS